MKEEDKIQIEKLIDSIITLKDNAKINDEHLVTYKNALLNIMSINNLDEVYCKSGNAKIISFDREGLIKDEVLDTFEKINDGVLDDVDIQEHIKVSPVKFVLVKA